jgi:hypothetical protein
VKEGVAAEAHRQLRSNATTAFAAAAVAAAAAYVARELQELFCGFEKVRRGRS